jgi:23S rRNA pseudouridine2605 synthase
MKEAGMMPRIAGSSLLMRAARTLFKPSPFMPRDRDKHNDSPRHGRDGRGKHRSDTPRRPKKKFAKRDFAGKKFGDDHGNRGARHRYGREDRGSGRPEERRDDFRRSRLKDSDRRGRAERDEKRWKPDDRRSEDRPKFRRSRWEGKTGRDHERPEGRTEWQEHPRSDRRFSKPAARDREDDRRANRPAFGGRGAYRERHGDPGTRSPRAQTARGKTGERIAKVLARAGLASRRDAEDMVVQGRVTVNGRVINSPALDVTVHDVISVDGKPLPARERTRLFLYHKPRGLITTHADPEGRPTVFDHLPEALPRLISIGRLDFNTEGLLLLTNDGGLARVLELPETGWLRRYRVRAHGEVTQAQLDALKSGIEVDGVKYGPIEASLERDQGANVWLVFAIREGKNREVRNVLEHLGLEVNRLIRVSYGPFQLGELAEGQVEEVRTRVLREQLGEKVIARSGADFTPGLRHDDREGETPRGNKPFKPSGKSALVSDRKGKRVLVQRTGSEEARARNEHGGGFGPPRRPKRGYHGKRDLGRRDT